MALAKESRGLLRLKPMMVRVRDLIDAYLRDLEAAGRSPATVRVYRVHLFQFLYFLLSRGLNIRTLSVRDLRRYRQWLAELPPKTRGNPRRAPSSINAALSALSGFFAFLVDEGIRSSIPFTRRLRVKQPQPDVRAPTKDEELEIMRWLEENAPERILLAFKTMRYAGLRVGEAAKLTPRDILVVRGLVRIRVVGKGSKIREVPVLDKETAQALLELKQKVPPGETLFGVKDCTLRWWAERASKATGIKFHTHLLRHAFATEALNRGVPVDVVQQWLGHSRLETTRRYAMTLDERVEEYARKMLEGLGEGSETFKMEG